MIGDPTKDPREIAELARRAGEMGSELQHWKDEHRARASEVEQLKAGNLELRADLQQHQEWLREARSQLVEAGADLQRERESAKSAYLARDLWQKHTERAERDLAAAKAQRDWWRRERASATEALRDVTDASDECTIGGGWTQAQLQERMSWIAQRARAALSGRAEDRVVGVVSNDGTGEREHRFDLSSIPANAEIVKVEFRDGRAEGSLVAKLSGLTQDDLLGSPEQRAEGNRVLGEMAKARSRSAVAARDIVVGDPVTTSGGGEPAWGKAMDEIVAYCDAPTTPTPSEAAGWSSGVHYYVRFRENLENVWVVGVVGTKRIIARCQHENDARRIAHVLDAYEINATQSAPASDADALRSEVERAFKLLLAGDVHGGRSVLHQALRAARGRGR